MMMKLAAVLSTMAVAAQGFVQPLEHRLEAKTNLLQGVSDLSATTVSGNRIFLFGGCVQNEAGTNTCTQATNEAYFYYPLEDRIEAIAGVPGSVEPRFRHSATVAGSKVYIIGGAQADDTFLRDMVIYDFETNTWEVSNRRLPRGVSDGAAFTLFGKVHYVGGWIVNYDHNEDMFVYDPATDGAFTTEDGLATDRGDVGVAVLDDRAYVVAGFSNDANAHVDKVEIYDALTETWSEAANAPVQSARGDKAIATMNGRIYVFGGETSAFGGNATETIEIYDPASDSWTFGGELPFARYRAAAAQVGSSVFIFGGLNHGTNELINTIEAFTETSGLYSFPTLTLHGSGTTNPSQFFWNMMDIMESQTRVPVKMSYRAVGSGVGQKEFTGNAASAYLPYTQFGSGDIPLPLDRYEAITEHGYQVAQIPFGFGAISVYVNIPEQRQVQGRRVVIPACQLAKIFAGELTKWSDLADVADGNEWLEDVEETITPVHRVKGSSSTSGVTAYMNNACPSEWGPGLVGSLIQWPCGNACIGAQGSGGVQSTIQSTPYSIGYLSVGHGYPDELREIFLVNEEGQQVQATSEGIQAAANAYTGWPSTVFDTFHAVSLINTEGAESWPIVLVSYVYVRRDLTALGSSAALLKAFLTHLMDPSGGQTLMVDYNFVPVVTSVRNMVVQGISQLQMPMGVTEFLFESSTAEFDGAGPFVFSGKRESFVQRVQEDTQAELTTLNKRVDQIELGSGGAPIDHDHDLEEDVDAARSIAIAALVFALLDLIILLLVLSCVLSLRKEMKEQRKARTEMLKQPKAGKERQDSQVSQTSEQSASAAVQIV